jgi:CheY-like chemotaxis protein
VIDDDPLARELVLHTLRDHYTVREAASVDAALDELRQAPPDGVVLDLVLGDGVDARPLHEAIARRNLPVVLISGVDGTRLPSIAESRGWIYLTKPCDPPVLLATIAHALAARGPRVEVRPTPDPRASRVTPEPSVAARLEATALPAAAEAPSQSPPRDPRVEIADLHSRRLLRGLIAILTTAVTLYFESRGHTVPTPFVLAMSVMALGVEGGLKAAKARPGVAAAGAVSLVGVALLGDFLNLRELSHLAVLGVGGGIPIGTEIADRLRV